MAPFGSGFCIRDRWRTANPVLATAALAYLDSGLVSIHNLLSSPVSRSPNRGVMYPDRDSWYVPPSAQPVLASYWKRDTRVHC